MMRLTFLALLGLVSLGCAEDPRTFTTVDAELVSYYEDFGADYEAHTGQGAEAIWFIGAGFVGKLKPNEDARCDMTQRKGRTYKQLFIAKERWENAPEGRRKAFIYHELGHCFLGRGHETGHTSIMQASIPMSLNKASEAVFKAYIYELFTNDDSEIRKELDK
jgi:hypothetical protein